MKMLNINNLRNLKSVNIDLHPELNYLVGDNGAGKTSVLESIVVLVKGRSFRSGQINTLLGPESERFRVVAWTEHHDSRRQTLGIERSRNEWRARRNGEDVKQLSDLVRHLPLVLIEPNSHLLVCGPPDGRRRFLDWGVFHVEQDYLVLWRRYSRALKQRNAALRKQDKAIVESIDEVLSGLGENIDNARRKQQQSLSAALLLSQARLMSETGEKPVLLMDDLASEFDESHLDRVLAAARLLNAQIWITGTSYVPYVSMGDGVHAMFHVEQGTITTKTTS